MPLSNDEFLALEDKARDLRLLTTDVTFWAGSAHIGGAMSVMDILTVLYYKYMKIDPQNPDMEDRDRFILSKGHAGVAMAALLADKGFIDKKELETFNLTGSKLGMHLDKNKVRGLDASTGSLGHGLSIGIGMALGARYQKKSFSVFAALGDGECDEGSVWKAAMAISHFKLSNLITFIDRNRLSIDGDTENVMALEPFPEKWRAFGLNVLVINGHDIKALCNAIDTAYALKDKPTVIICNTVKGCGIKEFEGKKQWHYGGLDEASRQSCKESILAYHAERRKQ